MKRDSVMGSRWKNNKYSVPRDASADGSIWMTLADLGNYADLARVNMGECQVISGLYVGLGNCREKLEEDSDNPFPYC